MTPQTRPAIVLACLAAVACDASPLGSGDGDLSVRIVPAAAVAASAIDEARVHVEGPTPRQLTLSPGTTQTIGGLLPGTYTVAIEGIMAGRVAAYGETANVAVAAGQNTIASLSIQSFIPTLSVTQATVVTGQSLTLTFSGVPGAVTYNVEWSANPNFGTPQTVETTSTSPDIPLASAGTYYFRVRAKDRFGSLGSASAEIAVVNVVPPTRHSLTVNGAGTGEGNVTGGGLACTISSGTQTGMCTALQDEGTTVVLTAAAADGSTFTGWSGACTGTAPMCSATMSQARTVTATFNTSQSSIAVTFAGGGGGSVAFNPAPAAGTCPNPATSACTAVYASASQTVVLTAAPDAFSTFTGWGGSCSGTATTCTVTPQSGKNVTVAFEVQQIVVTPASISITVFPFGQSGSYDEFFSAATVTGPGKLTLVVQAIQGTCQYTSDRLFIYLDATVPATLGVYVRPGFLGICDFSATAVIRSDVPGVAEARVPVHVAGKDLVDDAVAITGSAAAITRTSATLGGQTDGTYYNAFFEYSINSDMSASSLIDAGVMVRGPRTWNVPLQGLLPNTLYYYRMVAASVSNVSGAIKSFRTQN